MNCRRVVNLMCAYIDAELTGTEMLAIRRHISECDECAEEYESMRVVKHAVSRLASIAPRKDFASSILKTLDKVEIPPYQRAINSIAGFVHRKLSPVAATVAAFGVAMVILGAGGADRNAIGPGEVSVQPFGARTYEVSLVPASSQASLSASRLLEVHAPVVPDMQPSFRLAGPSH